jgi:hypothetical protein
LPTQSTREIRDIFSSNHPFTLSPTITRPIFTAQALAVFPAPILARSEFFSSHASADALPTVSPIPDFEIYYIQAISAVRLFDSASQFFLVAAKPHLHSIC